MNGVSLPVNIKTFQMKEIGNLHPKEVWKYFLEICQIPRPSKKEEKIMEYLIKFGESHGLETHRDEAGNVVIKRSNPIMENRQAVVLQSHMDMVCEKNSDVSTIFLKIL